MQITFAVQKNNLENLFRPAPDEILKEYIEARQANLKIALFKKVVIKDKFPKVEQIRLPSSILAPESRELSYVPA